LYISPEIITYYYHKMHAFRNRGIRHARSSQGIDTPATSVSNKPLPLPLDDIEPMEDINLEYGLSDMDDMAGLHGDLAEVSVDDEYTSYITAPPSHAPV
jgi:hypothetical protein